MMLQSNIANIEYISYKNIAIKTVSVAVIGSAY